MTPEEKAKELVQKFRVFVSASADDEGRMINNYLLSKGNAKKATLLCVEEIIDSQRELLKNIMPDNLEFKYWTEVKQHIENYKTQ